MKKRPWPGWLWRHDLGVPAPLLIGLFALPLLFAAVFLMDDILDALLSAFVLGPVWVLGSTLAISMSTQAPSTSRARCIVRSLVVTAIVPLSFTLALLPFILPRAAFDDARTLRFIVVKPWYDAQIAKLPRNQKPHIVVFVWGGLRRAASGAPPTTTAMRSCCHRLVARRDGRRLPPQQSFHAASV